MTEETPMLVDDVRARVADFRRRYWVDLTRGQVEALLTAGLDALTKAEADRDAYAAVAKAAIKWLWTDSDNDAHLLDVALDALTDEQKERIT